MNYSSVSLDLSGTHKSVWLDARSTASDQIKITVPANKSGTLTIEGSDDDTTILAENALNPSNSDASAATASDVTSNCTFDGSLTVNSSAVTVLLGSYVGSKKFIRVVWTPAAAVTGSLVVVVSGTSSPGDVPSVLDPSGNERAARRVYLDVRDYTVDGEALSQDNFQDALEAAYADALARALVPVEPITDASTTFIPRYMVRIPEGLWLMTRTLVIPSHAASTPQVQTPGLCGVEKFSTGLFHDFNQFDATGNAVIYAGGDVVDQYVHELLIENLHFQSHGGLSSLDAIVVDTSYILNMNNVDVYGMLNAYGRTDRGWAVKIINPTAVSANNQYPRLVNCRFQGCTGGVWATGAFPVRLRDVDCKQNTFADMILDGCTVSVIGGSIEGGGAGSQFPYHHASGKGGARIVTGWSLEDRAGTGAAVGTRSGDTTTVTGLTGVTAADLYRWLYLEKSSSAYNGSDLVSGYYLITEIVSSTSVKIRKGSLHSATSSLIWSIRYSGETHVSVSGEDYRESACYAGVGMYAALGGAGSVTLDGCMFGNTDYAVEALGCTVRNAASVVINNTKQVTAFVKARFSPSVVVLAADQGNIGDLDEASREGLVMRSAGQARSGSTGFVASGVGGIHTQRLPAGSARTMCRLGGANAIWDARVASSFNKSGANITSWTDILGGVVASLQNASKFPQYSASDAVFNNKPSVTFTGGTSANTCGLLATIPAASWGTSQFVPCMVAVMTTPAASVLAADTSCRVSLVIPAVSDLQIVMLEDLSVGAKYYGGLYPTGDNQPLGQTPTTAAHVFIHGGAGRSQPRLSSESDTILMSNFVNNGQLDKGGWNPADVQVHFHRLINSNTGTFSMAFFATFPFGLSRDAREQLLDALAAEFGVSR